MENKKGNLAGFACFIALIIATILFILQYILKMSAPSWEKYLQVAKDIAIVVGVVFGSYDYVKKRGIMIKATFVLAILVYIVFAILMIVY